MIFGENVALGPILPTDLGALFAWYDDPAVARLNEPYLPQNWARSEAYWLNAAGDGSRVFLAIRGRTDARILGVIQITAIAPIHRSATVGILIGAGADRGKGLGGEAMALAVDYCWRHLNLSRLALQAVSDNVPAIRLYERLGFRHEGVLRQALFLDGAWVDMALMALNHPSRTGDGIGRAA